MLKRISEIVQMVNSIDSSPLSPDSKRTFRRMKQTITNLETDLSFETMNQKNNKDVPSTPIPYRPETIQERMDKERASIENRNNDRLQRLTDARRELGNSGNCLRLYPEFKLNQQVFVKTVGILLPVKVVKILPVITEKSYEFYYDLQHEKNADWYYTNVSEDEIKDYIRAAVQQHFGQ